MLFFMVLFVILLRNKGNPNESIVKLNASFHYENAVFTITNNDTMDFVNARITVNEFYSIISNNLSVGETYTIWQVEFVHNNGRHFTMKQIPVKFSIWCGLKDGRKGYFNKRIKVNSGK